MSDISLQEREFIPVADVMRMVRLSRSGIYRAIQNNGFPAPVKFGAQKSVWIRAEVIEWTAERVAQRDRALAS
jgi:predicted DNA-binding transcriptional regulator AlpA